MYDDILGPKRKIPFHAGAKHNRIALTTYWKKINFQLDTPTKSGRIYPTHVVRDELNRKIPKQNYRNNFFLVCDTPKDPTIVQLDNVVGIILAYKIRGINVLLEIKYLQGYDAYSQFDIALCCLGSVDDKNVVKSPLTITQVYMI